MTQLETRPAGEQVAGFPGWARERTKSPSLGFILINYITGLSGFRNTQQREFQEEITQQWYWLQFSLKTVYIFFIFIFCFSLCSHWSPHLVWASPRSCHEPGLSEQACGAGSVLSTPLGACFSFCSAALQWREPGFHLPGSLSSRRALHSAVPARMAWLLCKTTLLLLRCRPSVHCGSSTSHPRPGSISGIQSYIQTTAAH